MLTTRILPPAEWSRLAETPIAASVWQRHDPASLQFVVVEDASGAIVATWATLICRHVEAFWVRPDHQRRGGALRRLFISMRALLTTLGATSVVTMAQDADVATLLIKAGATRLPGDTFLLPVDFGPWIKGS
jgi:hypothetical protein